jgi:multidrug resistance protein
LPYRLKTARNIVYFTIFLDLLGFGLIIPQLQYYADAFRATPAFIGVIQAIYSLMQFLFAPFWGKLSDRVGRRPVLLVSIAGSAFSYVLFALAQNAQMIFLSRLLAGITAANLSTAQAYISDVTPPQERTRAMGMIGAAFGVGFILGPAVGGLLGTWGGNFAIGMGGALLATANWISAFLRLPESLPHEKRRTATEKYAFPLRDLPAVLSTPNIGLLSAVMFTAVFAISNLEVNLRAFGEASLRARPTAVRVSVRLSGDDGRGGARRTGRQAESAFRGSEAVAGRISAAGACACAAALYAEPCRVARDPGTTGDGRGYRWTKPERTAFSARPC